VAIAGAGGFGGAAAVMLARLGVGEIRIADFDVFEPRNVARQFGAYPDTLGRNKAEVVRGGTAAHQPLLDGGRMAGAD
jgi:molybdopterin/thiamine biosynthesis adenylyltransferase